MLEGIQFYIVNDADKPYECLVAYKTNKGTLNYLDRSKHCYDGMSMSRATPLDDFGIRWILHQDGTFEFNQREESKATYYDGRPRKWQGLSKFFHKHP